MAKSIGPVLVLFVVGVLLRFIFWTGSAFPQSIQTSEVLWYSSMTIRRLLLGEISGGNFVEMIEVARAILGLRQLIFFSPSIFFYSLLGVSDWVTALYPLFSNLMIAGWLYLLSKENNNKAEGILSTWFWLISPLAIATSSTLFNFTPILALLLGSTCFFQNWLKKKKSFSLLVSIALLSFAALGEPFWGLVGLVLLVGAYTLSKWSPRRFWYLASVSGVIFLILYPTEIFYGLLGWYREFVSMPGTWFMLYLLGIMLIPSFKRSSMSAFQHFYLFWFALGIMAIGVCEGNTGVCTGFDELNLPVYTTFLLIPLSLLSAKQFADSIQSPNTNLKFMWLAISIGLLSVAIYFVPFEITPSYEAELYLSPRIILILSDLALAFVFLSIMAFVYFSNSRNQRWTQLLSFICIGLFSFATLQPNWKWNQQYSISISNIKNAFSIYETDGEGLPLTFTDESLATKAYYLSGFTSREEIPHIAVDGNPFRVVPDTKLYSVSDSFIIVQLPVSSPPPPKDWWLLSEYNEIDGNKLQLYRDLSDETSQNLVNEVAELLSQDPSAQNYNRLYGALINNNEPCAAYETWMRSKEIGKDVGYIQVVASANCFCSINAERSIDLTDSIEAIYPGAYVTIDQVKTTTETYFEITNGFIYYQDPRTLRIPITLEQGQFYLYSMDIRSNDPVLGLFIKSAHEEWYLPLRSYRDKWDHLEVLFSTHAWDAQQEVILSPALFNPRAIAEIKNYQIMQTQLCIEQ